MRRLVDDPDAVAALADRAASLTGIPRAHVEKDFWVTEALRGLVRKSQECGIPVVLKGGTSLSKGFSLIERFSEDVDVLVVLPPDLSTARRDRLLKEVVSGAQGATGLRAHVLAEGTSKGVRRAVRLTYSQESDGLLSRGVLLEVGQRGGAIPSSVQTIHSIIGQVFTASLLDAVESRSFEVTCLSPVRTLVEKLTLLHAASIDSNSLSLIKGARHYYDIYCILDDQSTMNELKRLSIDVIAREVFAHAYLSRRPAVGRPSAGFATSPAFSDGELLRQVRREYERVVDVLLWPNARRPQFDECLAMIRRRAMLI